MGFVREVTDAIVVGAGAGGGCVAKVLATAGIKVMLLERGEWSKVDVFGEDDLTSQRSPSLTLGPGVKGTRTLKSHYHDNGSFGVVRPFNAACVGSGTVTYGAMGWRFMETDFRLKSHYGELPGSSIEDWPITYDDLEPYYEQAEREIGVAGSDKGNPFAPKRKKDFPMPPFAYDPESVIVEKGMKKMGLHPFHIPTLRNSVPYNGRPACIHQRSCVGFQCPIDAKCGTQNTVIPVALASGNCDLRIRSIVTNLIVGDNGKLSGVRYVDENDVVHEVTAKVVVLAASSYSTARILMLSKSKKHPNGAGNNHDVVGRNITAHAYVDACGFMEDEFHEETGPGCGVACCDFNHDNDGFICGGVLHSDFAFTPLIFAENNFPGVSRWGKENKDFVRKNYKRFIRICGPFQTTPKWDCRIVLDESKKDYWGMPFVKKLNNTEHPNDWKGRCFMSDRAADILRACGAKNIFQRGNYPKPGWLPAGGQHQSGSCRMGSDPKKSVCDSWGRVWDFPNLFVADGSLHVNNGGFNPVLTIMALAFRVGDGIVKNWDNI